MDALGNKWELDVDDLHKGVVFVPEMWYQRVHCSVVIDLLSGEGAGWFGFGGRSLLAGYGLSQVAILFWICPSGADVMKQLISKVLL